MKQVLIRKVQTSLELKCRAAGGKKIADAISEAQSNLLSLGEQSLLDINKGLSRIAEIVGTGEQRPSPEDLAEIYTLADRLMGYCATIERPFLPRCLHTLCDLTDSVRQSTIWLPGTLTPMVKIAMLAVSGTFTEAEQTALMAGVRQCITRYRAAPGPDLDSAAPESRPDGVYQRVA